MRVFLRTRMENVQNPNPDPTPNPSPQTPAADALPKKLSLQNCTLFEFLECALHNKALWDDVAADFNTMRRDYEHLKATNQPPKTFATSLKYNPPPPPPPPITLSAKLEEREETPRQRANRLNARKSTGPRTSAGKARSSQNAIKHGLTSEVHLQTCFEEDGDFTLFQQELHNHFKPTDFYQRQLVGRIVTYMWRLRRTPIVEAQLLNSKTFDGHKPELAWMVAGADRQLLNLSRYESNLDRQLNRTLRLLNEAKATAEAATCGAAEQSGSKLPYSKTIQTSQTECDATLAPRRERVDPGSIGPVPSPQDQGRGEGDPAQRQSDKTNPIHRQDSHLAQAHPAPCDPPAGHPSDPVSPHDSRLTVHDSRSDDAAYFDAINKAIEDLNITAMDELDVYELEKHIPPDLRRHSSPDQQENTTQPGENQPYVS